MDVQVRLLFRAPVSRSDSNILPAAAVANSPVPPVFPKPKSQSVHHYRNAVAAIVLLWAVIAPAFLQAQQSKPDLRTYRERADEQFRAGNFKEANEFYDVWLKANPRDTGGYLMYARSLMKTVLPDKAMEQLRLSVAAGSTQSKAVDVEPEFLPLKRRKDWQEIESGLRQNENLNNEYQLRFAKQERWGRYRVLFPPKFDWKNRYHLVLLLHGNSQEPQTVLRWAKELQLEDAIIVCPEAPYVKVLETILQGKMRLSAAGEDLGMPDSLRASIVDESAEWYLTVLNDAERSLPLYRELPVVVGFSQGGFYTGVMMSRYPNRFLSAIMMCASYYDFGGIAERLPSVKKYGIDVLHVHAKQDPVVPFQTAELINSLFERNGITTTFIPYDGSHWMTPDITKRISDWIKDHFAR
ncbi:MAG: hypothetical protein JNL32_04965 [Candidatus Kapabacteria bacterium]|nr:hypothetical protein [Candidatus Kapabacteria bacterium]